MKFLNRPPIQWKIFWQINCSCKTLTNWTQCLEWTLHWKKPECSGLVLLLYVCQLLEYCKIGFKCFIKHDLPTYFLLNVYGNGKANFTFNGIFRAYRWLYSYTTTVICIRQSLVETIVLKLNILFIISWNV